VDNVVIRDLCYVVLAPNIVSTTLPVTTSTLLYSLIIFYIVKKGRSGLEKV
jgi:hypothetical protein